MRGRLLHTINSLALSVTCGDGEGEPAKEIQENIITLSALLRYILRPAAGKLGAKRR